MAVWRWLIGFFWPWNLVFMALTALTWFVLMPAPEVMRELSAAWIVPLALGQWLALVAFYGAFEGLLYVRRSQAGRFKYNGRFPAEQPSNVFWFKSQNLDNFLRSFAITVPIGLSLEVGLLWAYANGRLPTVDTTQLGLGLVVWLFVAAFMHEAHFFAIHRALHTDRLYRWVHAVHHHSVNPSPWSSMSMHPVEGTLYFGVGLWLLLLPGHPVVAIHVFTMAAFGAIVGHIGFDRLELPGGASLPSHAYAHYLHHRHFDVNYCDNGSLPLDRWFGSWHDGSPEGERLMQARYQAKVARLNARP
jgi:sterol desaturase/sphingolipid hydroxylase (fatty acid hydroxylase superfamily)